MKDIFEILAISSIISIVVNFIFDKIKSENAVRFEKIMLEKENRYRSILVFMQVVLNPINIRHVSTAYKPEGNGLDDLKIYYLEELKMHRDYCLLFADENVIDGISEFIDNPIDENYKKVSQAMRKDLWNKK